MDILRACGCLAKTGFAIFAPSSQRRLGPRLHTPALFDLGTGFRQHDVLSVLPSRRQAALNLSRHNKRRLAFLRCPVMFDLETRLGQAADQLRCGKKPQDREHAKPATERHKGSHPPHTIGHADGAGDKHATGLEQIMCARDGNAAVAQQVQNTEAQDDVIAGVWRLESFEGGLLIGDVFNAGLNRLGAGNGEHILGDVGRENVFHVRGVNDGGGAGAAAKFEHLSVGREIFLGFGQLDLIARLVADCGLGIAGGHLVPEFCVITHGLRLCSCCLR